MAGVGPAISFAGACVSSATAAILDVAPTGTVGVAGTVSVALDGLAPPGGVTVTLLASSGAALGTSTLVWSGSEAGTAKSTTISLASAGTSVVTMTNDGGLSNIGSGQSFVVVGAMTATLGGSAAAVQWVPQSYNVVLDREADVVYTVTWFQDGGNLGTTTIGAGTFATNKVITWNTAGSKTVSFNISPSIAKFGTPIPVGVSAAEIVSMASLLAPTQATQGASVALSVVLDKPADQTYSLAWTAANATPPSGTVSVGVGETVGAWSVTWAVASASQAVAFSITPTTNTSGASITKLNSPRNVQIIEATADTPTTATLTGLTVAEKDRWNVYLVTLDKPADRRYRVKFRQTGNARLYWSQFTIPQGERSAWTMAKWETDPAHAAGSTGSVDFVISPALSLLGGPKTVTIGSAVEPPPNAALLTGNGLAQAGFSRTYTVRLNAIADRDYTVTFSASNGATISQASVQIPTGWAIGTTNIHWPNAGASESVSYSISPSTNLDGETIVLNEPTKTVRVIPAFTPEFASRSLASPGLGQRVLQFTEFNDLGRYLRYINNINLSNTVAPIEIDVNVAGYAYDNPTSFQAAQYDILCYLSGNMGAAQVVGTFTPSPGNNRATAQNVNLLDTPSGWHLFDIRPSSGTTEEKCAPFWMYVGDPKACAFTEWVPTQYGSWTLNHEDKAYFRWGRVPRLIDPPTFVLPESATRSFPHFSNAETPSNLFRRNLVSPTTNGDLSFPKIITGIDGSSAEEAALDGIITTFSPHGYAFNVLAALSPALILRDGPFGVGTIGSLTHCEIGAAAPVETGPIDNRYFTDAWSMGKIRKTGVVKRLAGYRTDEMAGTILLGDWSRIEVAGKKIGFHETWGLAWDERKFTNVEGHPPIPSERGLRPHHSGILAFVTDSQNGRVLSLKFDRYEHESPPIVSVFKEFPNRSGEYVVGTATSMGKHADAWDCVARAGVLYVSERMRNRVSMWDIDTGASLGNIIAGPEYEPSGFYAGYGSIGYVRDDHWVVRTWVGLGGSSSWTNYAAVPAYVRQPDIIMPEGLYIMDNWLYVGSNVQGLVRRVNLDNPTQIETPHMFKPEGKSLYCKVTVSDGTFGPRHTVFTMTWEKIANSLPLTRLPQTDQQKIDGVPGNVWSLSTAGSVATNAGRGPIWEPLGYTCGVGQSQGRLLVATADYGMFELSQALPSDPPAYNKTRVGLGKELYETNITAGFEAARLRTGIGGFRPWKSQPLPWGQHADLDYYLAMNYHTP